jgi:hypothetical protein
MAKAFPNYYVISVDEGEELAFGFAWFVDLGRDPRGGSAFAYYATRDECVARAASHVHFTNPVLLEE